MARMVVTTFGSTGVNVKRIVDLPSNSLTSSRGTMFFVLLLRILLFEHTNIFRKEQIDHAC